MKRVTSNRRAFTLIELLVVVLIIGILAAVAVPQYTKAVEKSRTREAVLTLRNMEKAYELCLLQYGADSNECGLGDAGIMAHMDIELPGTLSSSCPFPTNCYLTQYWAYTADRDVFVADRIIGQNNFSYYLQLTAGEEQIYCYEIEAGACKNVCGASGCTLQ